MPKLAIAIDCDDVLVETAPLIISHYNKTYGTSLELKHFYTSDLGAWGVSDMATAHARVDEYLRSNEYLNAPASQAAIDATKRLAREYELHLVTGRNKLLSAATRDLLDRYFPGTFISAEFTDFFGSNPRSKADVCREVNAAFFIDDHLHHARDVAQAGMSVLLFGNYPWNQTDKLPDNIRRVKDWTEVEQLLAIAGS